MTSPTLFDREAMQRNLSRNAKTLADRDFLLQHAAEEILGRLELIKRPFGLAADTAAYHGVMAGHLRKRFSNVSVISLGVSPCLAERCPLPRAVASEEALPLKEGSLDLVTSVLSLHLANDLPGALIQIRRALRPDGVFVAAVLGGESLIELRQAFMQAEAETARGVSPRVFPTADVRDMGGLLQRAGFALPVTDSEILTVTYADPLALMQDLKAVGAANALVARSKVFLRRDTLSRARAIYKERFSTPNGKVRATFEILYLCGWAPSADQPKPLKPGSAAIRLADALKTREMSGGAKASFPNSGGKSERR